MQRRNLLYIVIDTSSSMQGEPIVAVQNGLKTMVASLNEDPAALESLHISIITFNKDATVLAPLTPIGDFRLPDSIEVPESSSTNMGNAIDLLCDCIDKDMIKSTSTQRGDRKPIVILMTDGSPSDTRHFKLASKRLKSYHFSHFVVLAAGEAKTEPLELLTTEIQFISELSIDRFSQYWEWASELVSYQVQAGDSGSQSFEFGLPDD